MAHQAEREEIENKKFVDYKDVPYLRQFMNPHAKILSKKRTGIPADKQRLILAHLVDQLAPDATGIEIAAFMLGGPFGIITSIWVHPKLVRRNRRT